MTEDVSRAQLPERESGSRRRQSARGDNLSGLKWKRSREHGTGVDAGMKLAALGAGIDARRKIAQQLFIEFAAGKTGRQFLGIDAGDARAQASGDHLAR